MPVKGRRMPFSDRACPALALWLINAGYFTLQFVIFGVILAAMG